MMLYWVHGECRKFHCYAGIWVNNEKFWPLHGSGEHPCWKRFTEAKWLITLIIVWWDRICLIIVSTVYVDFILYFNRLDSPPALNNYAFHKYKKVQLGTFACSACSAIEQYSTEWPEDLLWVVALRAVKPCLWSVSIYRVSPWLPVLDLKETQRNIYTSSGVAGPASQERLWRWFVYCLLRSKVFSVIQNWQIRDRLVLIAQNPC